MNSKDIIIVILLLAFFALGGWTFYTLKYTVPVKAEAECTKSCTAKITQVVTEKVKEVATKAQQCAGALEQLKAVPECAMAMQAAASAAGGTAPIAQ